MEKDTNSYNLDDIKKELDELYAKQAIQEEKLKIAEQSEQYEQVGYDDSDNDYEPPISERGCGK